MTKYNLELPIDLKRQFQKILIDEGKSMAEVLREMISNYVLETQKRAY